MPRRRDDDDDDFDDVEVYDENGRPLRGQPRRRDSGAGGTPWLVFGAIGGGAVVVIAAFVMVVLLVGARRAERDRVVEEQMIAQAESVNSHRRRREPENVRPAPEPNPQVVTGQNWPKVIGKWKRTPAGQDDIGYPYFFEFRPDRGVTMTRINNDGSPKTLEATAETQLDIGESLTLWLHVPMGKYGYSFKLKPDGTLVLDDWKGGLVFTRVE